MTYVRLEVAEQQMWITVYMCMGREEKKKKKRYKI